MRITEQERQEYERPEPFFEGAVKRGTLEDEVREQRITYARALLKDWQEAPQERLDGFDIDAWRAIAVKALLALDALIGDEPLEIMGAAAFAKLLGTTQQNVSLAGKRALSENYRGDFLQPDAVMDGRPLWIAARARRYARERGS
ncbi:MAG: hypothetical protein C6P35_03340 [Cohnella sp.]|uniref:hypothetical protein n=1 Tax=Cohnella sp. TaxID=1883426 RepID=UPI000E391ED2|nr:hypothetical protein [Cohnella sp.]REK68016.1 MAG: hypothetical protein C6P35_03340 [Cohnella sp.]